MWVAMLGRKAWRRSLRGVASLWIECVRPLRSLLQGGSCVHRATKTELERTRGTRLFNKNTAHRWPQLVLTVSDFCPVL